jgi:hypothetical protein
MLSDFTIPTVATRASIELAKIDMELKLVAVAVKNQFKSLVLGPCAMVSKSNKAF